MYINSIRVYIGYRISSPKARGVRDLPTTNELALDFFYSIHCKMIMVFHLLPLLLLFIVSSREYQTFHVVNILFTICNMFFFRTFLNLCFLKVKYVPCSFAFLSGQTKHFVPQTRIGNLN